MRAVTRLQDFRDGKLDSLIATLRREACANAADPSLSAERPPPATEELDRRKLLRAEGLIALSNRTPH